MNNLTGRKVLYTDHLPKSMIDVHNSEAPILDEKSIPTVLHGLWLTQCQNIIEINYLNQYAVGRQDILDDVKVVRPDIDNKVIFNNALMISKAIVGYTFGKPIRYVHRKEEVAPQVSVLNDLTEMEEKFSNDLNLAFDSSICGTAYRGVFADVYGVEDEVAFSLVTLPPQDTFVVYSTHIGNPPVMACTRYAMDIVDGLPQQYVFLVYTKDMVYKYVTDDYVFASVDTTEFKGSWKNALGIIPIIEYPNNKWRLGDWEIVKTLLDAINRTGSDCVNDLDGFVNSLLVGINVDLKDVTNEELTSNKIISFPSLKDAPSDIKYISQMADAESVENLRNFLIDQMRILVGLPSVDSGSNSGDTGDAVFLRDGFDRLESVARIKETSFRRSERATLKLILKILEINGTDDINLKSSQIDIKFTRNLTDSILVKANALAILNNTKIFDPVDALELVGLTTEPDEKVKRGQAYYADHPEEVVTPNDTKNNPLNETKVDR